MFAIFGTSSATAGFAPLVRLDANTRLGLRILRLFQSPTLNIQVAAPKRNGGVLMATSLLALSRIRGRIIGSTLGQALQSVIFLDQLENDPQLPRMNLEYLINEPPLIYEFLSAIQELITAEYMDGFRAVMYRALTFMASSTILCIKLESPSPSQGDCSSCRSQIDPNITIFFSSTFAIQAAEHLLSMSMEEEERDLSQTRVPFQIVAVQYRDCRRCY